MKKFLPLLLVFCTRFAHAQEDSVSIDQLQVPSSPAFNILDISPNSIERPKNPTDFALALGNATSGFTVVPKDYAIEIAPYWVFSKKSATYRDFKADLPGKNILQTATFSLGTRVATSIVDSSEYRKVALALKFSVWRGHMGKDFAAWNDSVYHYLGRLSFLYGQSLATLLQNDSLLRRYQDSAHATSGMAQIKWLQALTKRNQALDSIYRLGVDSVQDYQENVAMLQRLIERSDFRRYGFKMDYAIGTAIDYPDSSFQSAYGSRFSTWLTLGFEKEQGLNWLGVIRYNQNFNRFYRNLQNELVKDINIGDLDYGLRFYSDVTTKLTISFEFLQRRHFFNENKLSENRVELPENTNRYVFSANYKVGRNQNLSFTYGKNFDNTVSKGGNLIAALNFLIGFGSVRPVGGNQ